MKLQIHPFLKALSPNSRKLLLAAFFLIFRRCTLIVCIEMFNDSAICAESCPDKTSCKISLSRLDSGEGINSSGGSKEEFITEFGDQPLGTFIRSIIGLDQEAIHNHFASFIDEANLSAKQIKFMDTVICYFVTNGYLETADLMEPPFTELDDSGVIGLFEDNEVHKLIGLIREVNQNADIGA